MPFEDYVHVEYKYNWLSEDIVHIGHFLVKDGFGKGHGSKAFTQMVNKFEQEGARKLSLNIGGGIETEAFLQEMDSRNDFNIKILSVSSDGNNPVRAEVYI